MDDADISDERIEMSLADAVRDVRKKAAAFIVGNPGECDKCGENMPRLVDGICCPCRDRYRIG